MKIHITQNDYILLLYQITTLRNNIIINYSHICIHTGTCILYNKWIYIYTYIYVHVYIMWMFNNMYAGYINLNINLYHGLIMVQQKWLQRRGSTFRQGALQMLFTAPVQLHGSLQRGLRSRPVAQIWRPDLGTREKHGGDQLEWGKHGVNMVKIC